MKKRYYNSSTKEWYTEGNSLTKRVNGSLFSGIPNVEQLYEWGFEEWIEPESTPAELLERAKASKINELNNYDLSNAVNSFTINNQVLWLDSLSRQLLRTSLDAYKALNRNTVSKWFNGVEFTFPLDTWYNMLNALEVYAGDALNITELHKAIINKLDNIDDINNYDFTTDYPKKLEFNIDNK